MDNRDLMTVIDPTEARVIGNKMIAEGASAIGRFHCECRDKDGNLKWEDDFDNIITTEGKRYLLDGVSAANGWTAVHMGLISSVGYTGSAIADTAAQINGTNAWKEAGSSVNYPLISTRSVPSFSAAALGTTEVNKVTTATSFSIITTGGTVKGAIIVINGTSAVGNTTGKLFSAGTFSGGDKVVAPADTLNVTYTATLT